MKYYISEYDEGKNKFNAGSKARNDVDRIFAETGAQALTVEAPCEEKREQAGMIRGLYYHFAAEKAWRKALKNVKAGDAVLFQFPVKAHTIRLDKVLRSLHGRNIHTVALVHDLEYLRNVHNEGTGKGTGWRLKQEEVSALKEYDRVIVHNERMRQFLTEEMGIAEDHIILLEIFDYLIPEFEPKDKVRDKKAVIIAGNLNPDKCGYINLLPSNVQFGLYGADWRGEETERIRYHGKFLPDELPGQLEGGFGLVWDGPEAESCSGVYGDYMRYNNPHKTSLYLATGIPVIIWEEAAMAAFIRREGCGITINGLGEIAGRIDGMTEAEYAELQQQAERIGERLREGYYTKKALEACYRYRGGMLLRPDFFPGDAKE